MLCNSYLWENFNYNIWYQAACTQLKWPNQVGSVDIWESVYSSSTSFLLGIKHHIVTILKPSLSKTVTYNNGPKMKRGESSLFPFDQLMYVTALVSGASYKSLYKASFVSGNRN